ncbi:MAG: translation elongation factor-like protein [Candidatus Aenigmatarchaeota archaeon]|mgnify:CR=1 FL=1|nr:MAG: translation elongation factor-like protein [Candidatus Aenigmarchaeota archaeon]
MEEDKKLVGKVTHYYGKIGVAVVELEDELKLGDEISIEGKTTNFKQKVESMQIEHKPIEVARAGDSIGLKVIEKVREGDKVYKIIS